MIKAGCFPVETEWQTDQCVLVVPLHETIDEYDIRLKFGKYGKVDEIEIREFETGRKPRRAVVRFAFAPSSKACSKALNGKFWRGMKTMVYTMDWWRLQEKRNTKNQNNTLKLFVSNIPFSVTKRGLQCYFQQFGPLNLENTTMKIDRRGKRIAFVSFNSESCLDIALRSSPHFLNGEFLNVVRMTINRQGNLKELAGVSENIAAQTETKVCSVTESQVSRSSSCKKEISRERSRSRRSSTSADSGLSYSGQRSPCTLHKRSRSRSISRTSSENSSSTSDTQSESENPSKSPKSSELTVAEAAKYKKELEQELLTIKNETADVESERKRRRERWRNKKQKQ